MAWYTAKRYFDAAQSLKNSPFSSGEGENKTELDEKLLLWQWEQERKAIT